MNFLKKLDILMSSKGLNKHTLSQQCGIPYTTIDAFYKKGYDNAKLSTIRKLADFFDTTLDYLMRDEIIDVNYGVSKSNNFQFSSDTLDVAKAYNQAEFKDKNMARYALDLPPLKKEDEPSKINSTHIPDIKKITQEALEFKKAMNKAQLKK